MGKSGAAAVVARGDDVEDDDALAPKTPPKDRWSVGVAGFELLPPEEAALPRES